MNLSAGMRRSLFMFSRFSCVWSRSVRCNGSLFSSLRAVLSTVLNFAEILISYSIVKLSLRSSLIMPGGILPSIFLRVMLYFNAGWNAWSTHGFLILSPLKSISERFEFVAKDWASHLSPTSSVKSLFFERLRISMPLLWPIYFAKSTKPLSEKAFLLKSSIFRV